MKETADRWRSWCRNQGIGELFLAFTQSFETANPSIYGLDAAIEFPPNNSGAPDISRDVELLDRNFSGVVYDWRIFPRRSRSYSDPKYPLFRGVNSGWDNDARRPGSGAIFYGSSPSGYRKWLENALEDTLHRIREPDERLVFINAWNEWAEGAHLEPDQRYGYAYLQATRDALVAARMRWRRRILVVTHDARLHGAQLLALHIAQELYHALGYRVHVLSLGPGPLMDAYSKYGDARMIDVEKDGYKAVKSYANHLKSLGLTVALVNSTASAGSLPSLKAAGMHVVTLIHELPDLIRRHRLEEYARVAATQADTLVFPANQVEQGFANYGPLARERVRIRPQGLYKRNRFGRDKRAHARTELRRRLRLSPDAMIILGVGFGDHRKGFDLFVDAGVHVAQANPRTVCVWVGLLDPSLESQALLKIDESGLLEHFVFPGHESETDLFYSGADVYAMTSREDPFPSVILEALDAGLPVVGFRGAGGFSELEATGCVRLVTASDVAAFAEAVAELLRNIPERRAIAEKARALIDREFSFRRYVFDLLSFSPDAPPRISVVVPNYNYLRYLPERIRTIQAQTVPVYEIIILDDCSSDGSQEWLTQELPKLLPDAQVVLNQVNSGSVFEQWRTGVSLTRGDYVWIAEADDLAKSDFLAEVITAFEDRRVVLSYSESEQIDEQGEVLARDYLDYVADISQTKWRHSYIAEGIEEIRTCLAVKNTIPNVSAVVFRRNVLADILEANIQDIKRYRVAGDWLAYVQALRSGHLAFCPTPLNRHRRHRSGVTILGFGGDQLQEILAVQALIRTAFSPDSATTAKAIDYAERLYHQFGLGTAARPTIHEDPSLAPMLEMDTRNRE
jgi:glycosyltransferase involved in cell wall biosynthesis